MNDLSLSSSPQLCICFSVISIKRHIHGKSFYAERTPPQLLFSAHKKQVEKRMASVGEVGGLMEGDDR